MSTEMSSTKMETVYKCKSCDKSFNQELNLKNHVLHSHKNKVRKCDSCDNYASSEVLLVQKKSWPRNILKDILESGQNTFARLEYQKNHIHTVHKDYNCAKCNKSFNTAFCLKMHIRTVHEGQKRSICDMCNKSFSQSGYLTVHIRRFHEGRKDYRCDSCKKLFTAAYSLKEHIHARPKRLQV